MQTIILDPDRVLLVRCYDHEDVRHCISATAVDLACYLPSDSNTCDLPLEHPAQERKSSTRRPRAQCYLRICSCVGGHMGSEGVGTPSREREGLRSVAYLLLRHFEWSKCADPRAIRSQHWRRSLRNCLVISCTESLVDSRFAAQISPEICLTGIRTQARYKGALILREDEVIGSFRTTHFAPPSAYTRHPTHLHITITFLSATSIMSGSLVSHLLLRRDAAADEQAAAAAAAGMAAWSAGIAYAINFIVLYLTFSLTVVVVVGVMGCLASSRVRRSPPFIILLTCTALCICALGVNISMNKDLVVNPQVHFNASIYTSLIALSMGKSHLSLPLKLDCHPAAH